MEVLGIILGVVGIVATILLGIPPIRRRMTPRLRFLDPIPQPDGQLRWWHVPVIIEEPESWIKSQFTKRKIIDCEADIIIRDFAGPVFQMHWRSEGDKGTRKITLRYGHPEMIPVAIRAEVACPVYVDPNHNPRLSLAKGEAYISDHNFVHGYVKTNAASLEPNPEYDLMIKLFSAEHPGWEPKQTYILIVPGKNDSNSAFTLIPC